MLSWYLQKGVVRLIVVAAALISTTVMVSEDNLTTLSEVQASESMPVSEVAFTLRQMYDLMLPGGLGKGTFSSIIRAENGTRFCITLRLDDVGINDILGEMFAKGFIQSIESIPQYSEFGDMLEGRTFKLDRPFSKTELPTSSPEDFMRAVSDRNAYAAFSAALCGCSTLLSLFPDETHQLNKFAAAAGRSIRMSESQLRRDQQIDDSGAVYAVSSDDNTSDWLEPLF